MNRTLYYSSIILGACMLGISFIVKYVPRLVYVYAITFLGIITSILNHGSSNPFYQFVDRVVIFVATIVYLYYIFLIKSSMQKAVALCIIGAMILLYMYSKYVKYRKNQSINNCENTYVTSSLLLRGIAGDGYSNIPEYTHIHLLCHILAVGLFYILIRSFSKI